MKKIASILLIVFVLATAAACGPKSEYVGTYVKVGDTATFTVTFSKNGEFKFERKYNKTNEFNPYDNENNNVRKGTFSLENGKAVIEFSYYDELSKKTVFGEATATLDGNKLVIIGSEISGTYVRK